MTDNITPIDDEVSGMAHILYQKILNVIDRPEFDQMTVAEVIGVLELAKFDIAMKCR